MNVLLNMFLILQSSFPEKIALFLVNEWIYVKELKLSLNNPLKGSQYNEWENKLCYLPSLSEDSEQWMISASLHKVKKEIYI